FVTVSGVTLGTPRNFFTAIVTGKYLYVIGGLDATGGTQSVERSEIGPDGSIGPFTSDPSNVYLNYGRGAQATAMIGNVMYVLGGLKNGVHVNSIERATINPDASLSSFALVNELALPETRARHTVVAVDNMIHLIGGETTLSDNTIGPTLNVE